MVRYRYRYVWGVAPDVRAKANLAAKGAPTDDGLQMTARD